MSKAYSAPHNTLVKQDEHFFFLFFFPVVYLRGSTPWLRLKKKKKKKKKKDAKVSMGVHFPQIRSAASGVLCVSLLLFGNEIE